MIRRHLALVFAHDIDSQIDGGDPKVKAHLDAIHACDKNTAMRC